jgi:hypothetical protein
LGCVYALEYTIFNGTIIQIDRALRTECAAAAGGLVQAMQQQVPENKAAVQQVVPGNQAAEATHIHLSLTSDQFVGLHMVEQSMPNEPYRFCG